MTCIVFSLIKTSTKRYPNQITIKPLLKQAALLTKQKLQVAGKRVVFRQCSESLTQRRLIDMLLRSELRTGGMFIKPAERGQQQVRGAAADGILYADSIEVTAVKMRLGTRCPSCRQLGKATAIVTITTISHQWAGGAGRQRLENIEAIEIFKLNQGIERTPVDITPIQIDEISLALRHIGTFYRRQADQDTMLARFLTQAFLFTVAEPCLLDSAQTTQVDLKGRLTGKRQGLFHLRQ